MSKYEELRAQARARKSELEHFGMPGNFGVDPAVLLALIADAERYQWLCDGNGYYLEEAGLCGHSNEKDKADAAIDFYIANGCPP